VLEDERVGAAIAGHHHRVVAGEEGVVVRRAGEMLARAVVRGERHAGRAAAPCPAAAVARAPRHEEACIAQLEERAGIVRSACGRPEEVAGRVGAQSTWVSTIGSDEAVQYGRSRRISAAGLGELEYRAIIICAAKLRRAEKIAGAIDDQARERGSPVGTIEA